MWQDKVFAVGGVLFILALLPMFLSSVKPPTLSCVMNSTVLSAFAFAQLTLNLRLAFITSSILAVEWFLLGLTSRGRGS